MTLRRLTLVLFLLGLAPGIAKAQTKIGGCTTISAPGPYVLTKNITASISDLTVVGPSNNPYSTCIVVAADFVTLDLAGYTIAGPGVAPPAPNYGITGDVVHQGIEVRSGAVTNFSGAGIWLVGSGNTVEHVRAIGNLGSGMVIQGGTVTGNRVVGNTANSNGGFGISVACPAVVLENVATGNSGGDIISSGSGCTMAENSPAP